jgi:hypothetical protein
MAMAMASIAIAEGLNEMIGESDLVAEDRQAFRKKTGNQTCQKARRGDDE